MHTSAFDDVASSYDAEFTHTSVGKALRDIVWSRADSLFLRSHHILELGCGTGEDAMHLARAGARVTATDASARMIEVARQKQGRGFDRIDFRCLRIEDVGTAFPAASFDAVFSNFGAVNCVTDLSSMIAATARLLTPGAALLWVVMGRRAPWEWMWYLARGKPGKAFRRFSRTAVKWRGLTISYPSPATLGAALAPSFSVSRISPLGCVLPPSYAAGWLNHSPRMLSTLTRCEEWAQQSQSLAAWADHYVIEARRLPDLT